MLSCWVAWHKCDNTVPCDLPGQDFDFLNNNSVDLQLFNPHLSELSKIVSLEFKVQLYVLLEYFNGIVTITT